MPVDVSLKNDFRLDVATANVRTARRWKNAKWLWSDFAAKCAEPVRTEETLREYRAAPRDRQGDIKDVGGFVGGYLAEGSRKTAAVKFRSMATLDLDFARRDTWERFQKAFHCAALVYSTHKHTPEEPRLRLVVPFSREVTPDEYEPVCRRIAERVGIEEFDQTTYQLARMFYWPSVSRDGEFFFRLQDGPALDVDEVLKTYRNPLDASEWPQGSREEEVVRHELKQAGDPREKPGVIGAFCRVYSIEEAIAAFIPDRYDETPAEGRYTYTGGTATGGLVCYDHLFAYSNHESDPASRQCCNAFDLVRLHLFGPLDKGSRSEDVTARPSYKKMQELAAADTRVRADLTRRRLEEARADFEGMTGPDDGETVEAVETVETVKDGTGGGEKWMQTLEYNRQGRLQPTKDNIIKVLENDRHFKGKFYHDTFSSFYCVRGGLPWNRQAAEWCDADESNLRVWLERHYGLSGKEKVADAVTTVFTAHPVHPIRDYLNSLKWDGVRRLDRLVIDYIGAEDTELNRAMTRKHFAAAVARVMRPGCKYDHCLILSGPEGVGKSTLFAVMGGKWFSDSVTTLEGKEGMEQLRNCWIIELAELTSVRKADVETVKAQITKQVDRYRPAYNRNAQNFMRQCVFSGTTNKDFFLKGDTGNRRFWVIAVDPAKRKPESYRDALERDRDQLWAEARAVWEAGETLYLEPRLEEQARAVQEAFNDDADDPMMEDLKDFLDMTLPQDWYTPREDADYSDYHRRSVFVRNYVHPEPWYTLRRDRVCAMEFLWEMEGVSRLDAGYKYKARAVNKALEVLGWKRVDWLTFPFYGKQRGYIRPGTQATIESNKDAKSNKDVNIFQEEEEL